MATSKRSVAIGLAFNAEVDGAPNISIKGKHATADRIVAAARRYGVPVVPKAYLAKALDALETDEEIPEDLYEAVAVILAELYPVMK